MKIENIAFLIEDIGYFIKKIKMTSSTRVYIVDMKMNQIREIDLSNFIKETIEYDFIEILGEREIIFVENCEIDYHAEEFLIWKLNNEKKIEEDWLLIAIGLYRINYKKTYEIKREFLSLKEKISLKIYNPFMNTRNEPKENIVKNFLENITNIESQWNSYSTKADEMEEIKKVSEILKQEKIYYNTFIFNDFYNMKNEKNQFVLKGHFYRNKENYICYYKEVFLHHLSEIINKSRINKGDIYSACFNDEKTKKISKILNHKEELQFKDYPNLAIIINFLKEKNKQDVKFFNNIEEYYLDYLYFKCLNFEFFEKTKNYNRGIIYLKINFPLKKNWVERTFEKFIVDEKEIYVERLEPNNVYCMDTEFQFLYIKGREKQIKYYDSKEEEYLIGKIYSKKEIERMKETVMLVTKRLN